jgi:hypothetical protein
MLDKNEIKKIKKQVKEEFLYDMALQQIHIARKILAKEAEFKGMSYLEYIRSITKDI